jgi:hypothetical protein
MGDDADTAAEQMALQRAQVEYMTERVKRGLPEH